MKWIETTDKSNPTCCDGQFCFNIPWLECSVNEGMAHYSVTKDYSGAWEPIFWHGNMGHRVNRLERFKTDAEAKAECFKHMKRMHKELSAQIDEILADESEE